MKITTKFNCGDKFFAIDNGKIVEHEVRFFTITTQKFSTSETQETKVEYYPLNKVAELSFLEDKMFKSRLSLIRSL